MFNFPHTLLRKVGLFSLILLFILTGLNHLGNPDLYVSIIPPYLPLRHELSYITGFFEILGATGLLFAKTRKLSGYGLIVLLIAIFPANIYMALDPEAFPHYHAVYIYLRLPAQIVFIAWVYWATLRVKAIGHNEEY
jgi:uncharacterized membrane protein